MNKQVGKMRQNVAPIYDKGFMVFTVDKKDISALNQNLLRLCFLRLVALTGLFISLGIANYFFSIKVFWHIFIPTVVILLIINALTFYRAKVNKPVTNKEFAAQLIVDILLFSILIYLSGGITNPFASYFLVPVIISAATLSYFNTWFIALLTLVSYSTLAFYYMPITHMHHHMQGDFLNWHFIGMLANFILTVLIVMFFSTKMGQTLNEQRADRNKFREKIMRDEQVLAIAYLAAGFAHELRTPLSTLNILIHELIDETPSNHRIQNDLSTMEEQVTTCNNKITELLTYMKNAQNKQWLKIHPQTFIENTLGYWQLIRPHAQFKVNYKTDTVITSNNQLEHDYRLQQVFINLLNNAADSCDNIVHVIVSWDTKTLTIEIADQGKGIPPEIESRLGEPFTSTKSDGLGLGFYLSHATISDYQGHLSLQNRKVGGTLACIQLPLKRVPYAI